MTPFARVGLAGRPATELERRLQSREAIPRMPAPLSSLSPQAASMTSSGYADGLGRRALAFDREEGVMLERLVLRPELGAFEAMLRDRLDRLATLEDERIARPRTIERDLDGSLVVVSEFVPGSRLSDLLETAAEAGVTPGVDAALGFLLDVLPALCGLHAGAGFAHGSIAPSRTVLTPAGQIVLLDGIYGGALTHLRYGRRKLWTDFAIATSPRIPTQRLHVETDIAQAALAAVMLILGRPLHADEYPDGIAAVVREVGDVAEIRGSGQFAARLQSFLDRALQQRAGAPYTAADDALFDVRELASELGLHVCRRALVDFIEQMESPAGPRRIEELDDELAGFGLEADHEASMLAGEEQDPDGGVDAQLDIDSLADGAPDEPHELTEDVFARTVAALPHAEEEVDWVAAAAESTRGETERLAELPEPPAAVTPDPVRGVITAPPPPVEASEAAAEDMPDEAQEDPASVEAAAASLGESDESSPAAAQEQPVEPEAKPVLSRRAKRATRSARARKDKLRSAAEASTPALAQASAAPAAAPAAKKSSSPWMVAPGRAADFEPIVETAPAPPPVAMPAPVTAPPPLLVATVLAPGEPPAAVPPVPLYAAPPPPAPLPPPPPVLETSFSRTVGAIAPSYDTPPAWTPPPVTAPAPPVVSSQPQFAQVKLKDSGPRTRTPRSEPVSSDIYSTPLPAAIEAEAPPSAFPWKLVAALAVIVVGAVIGGRAYLPASGAADEDQPPAAVAAATPPPAVVAPVVPGTTTGRLEIETQPAGARILIDGKAAGESPVALDGIAVGRHTVTLISSSGSIKRTIRIEAGRTARLDVPIFSGWVGIYAPFVVEVVEGGRVIGTTDEPRLMLSPGRHELTLVNRDLDYTSSQSVDIEPGEVRSISIDPRGTVNFNATPWAEVWIDGRKVGDTPIANLQLSLGTREVTFRHPQLGERRVSVTVKGGPASAVSVDLTKPGI